MLTDEQYQRMVEKAKSGQIPDDMLDEAIKMIGEYQSAKKPGGSDFEQTYAKEVASYPQKRSVDEVPSFLSTGAAQPLEETMAAYGEPKPAAALPNDESRVRQALGAAQPSTDVFAPGQAASNAEAEKARRAGIDTKLASASQRKDLYVPPEYHPAPKGSPLSDFMSVMPSVTGGGTDFFEEPSLESYQRYASAFMGDAAYKLTKNSPGYQEYADQQWGQTVKKAAADGRGAVRLEYVESPHWADKVVNYGMKGLGAAAGAAAGFDQGATGGLATKAVGKTMNAVGLGGDQAMENLRNLGENHEIGSAVGAGAGMAVGAPAKVAKLVPGIGSGAGGALVTSMARAGAGTAAHSALSDIANTDLPASEIAKRAALAGGEGAAVAAPFHLLGELAGLHGESLRKNSALPAAEAGGARTNVLTGVSPGEEIAEPEGIAKHRAGAVKGAYFNATEDLGKPSDKLVEELMKAHESHVAPDGTIIREGPAQFYRNQIRKLTNVVIRSRPEANALDPEDAVLEQPQEAEIPTPRTRASKATKPNGATVTPERDWEPPRLKAGVIIAPPEEFTLERQRDINPLMGEDEGVRRAQMYKTLREGLRAQGVPQSLLNGLSDEQVARTATELVDAVKANSNFSAKKSFEATTPNGGAAIPRNEEPPPPSSRAPRGGPLAVVNGKPAPLATVPSRSAALAEREVPAEPAPEPSAPKARSNEPPGIRLSADRARKAGIDVDKLLSEPGYEGADESQLRFYVQPKQVNPRVVDNMLGELYDAQRAGLVPKINKVRDAALAVRDRFPEAGPLKNVPPETVELGSGEKKTLHGWSAWEAAQARQMAAREAFDELKGRAAPGVQVGLTGPRLHVPLQGLRLRLDPLLSILAGQGEADARGGILGQPFQLRGAAPIVAAGTYEDYQRRKNPNRDATRRIMDLLQLP